MTFSLGTSKSAVPLHVLVLRAGSLSMTILILVGRGMTIGLLGVTLMWGSVVSRRNSNCEPSYTFFSGRGCDDDREVYAWKNEVRDPQFERPGVYAVDGTGHVFIAVGGDDYNGAERWLVKQPAVDD